MAFDFDMPNIAGNYVVNIKDFSEPTLLKVTWIGLGTMSWRMTPPPSAFSCSS